MNDGTVTIDLTAPPHDGPGIPFWVVFNHDDCIWRVDQVPDLPFPAEEQFYKVRYEVKDRIVDQFEYRGMKFWTLCPVGVTLGPIFCYFPASDAPPFALGLHCENGGAVWAQFVFKVDRWLLHRTLRRGEKLEEVAAYCTKRFQEHLANNRPGGGR